MRVVGREDQGDGLAVTAADPTAGTHLKALYKTFERGAVLDRFTVVDKLGEGAMGVVVAAYDPDLDRKVAIKLLHTKLLTSEDTAAATERLMREAQATAKLAHDNVVTVHEVGETDGRVFLVMEYIDGGTLADWLDEAPRSWREIVSMLVRAGRGLAAAHAQGLVHRDFKPDNVLVAKDGRVRVSDFGLVSTDGLESSALGDSTAELRDGRSPLDLTLTRTGAVMGTPRFMAAEQHAGEASTPASDQFAFCVALYRALYGQFPFAGDTVGELATSVRAGDIRAPAERADAPARLHAMLARGLRAEPSERFESMDVLLARLEQAVRPSRTRAYAGIAAVALFAIAAGGLSVQRGCASDRPACTSSEAEMAKVWGADRRARVVAAFQGSSSPLAADALEHVLDRLDAQADAWIAMRQDSCEATLDGHQTERILELRERCLSRRRDQMDAVIELLAVDELDEASVAAARKSVFSLTTVDACADIESLESMLPLPDDPDQRAEVAKLRKEIERAKALTEAGRTDESIPVYDELYERAKPLGYSQIEAELLLELADAQLQRGLWEESNDSFRRAALAAGAARDDFLLSKALSKRIFVVGARLGNREEALALVDGAEAALARANTLPELRHYFYVARGAVYVELGRNAEARADIERTRETAIQVFGPESFEYAASLHNLAILLLREPDPAERAKAVAYQEQALAIQEQGLGPNHPDLALTLTNLSGDYLQVGQLPQACDTARRAIDNYDQALPEFHPAASRPRLFLARCEALRGNHQAAIDAAEQGLRIAERAPLDRTGFVIEAHELIARSNASLGRWDAADEHMKAAAELCVATDGNDPGCLWLMHVRARMLWAHGADDEAVAILEHALEIAITHHGADSEQVANVYAWSSDAYTIQGEQRRAVEYIEKALEIVEPDSVHYADFLYGNVWWLQYVQGEVDEALQTLDHAERILTAHADDTHARLIARLRGLTLSAAGDHEAAIAQCERALQLATEQSLEAKQRAGEHLSLGEVLLDAGRPADALPHLERAVEGLGQDWEELLGPYRARFLLARALWESGGDRRRALELARTALAAYRNIGNDPTHRRQLEKWLRSVGAE